LKPLVRSRDAHEKRLYAGAMAFEHGKPQRAIEILEELRKSVADPETKRATLVILGKALAKVGRHRSAITKFTQVLSVDPSNSEVRNALGESFLATGNPNAAVNQFRTASRFHPEYAQAHKNLGKMFLKKGEFEKAEQHLQNAIELSEDWEPRYLLARALHETGRNVEAETLADDAMRLLERVTKTPKKTKIVVLDNKNHAAAAALRARCLRAIKGKPV